MGEWVGNPPESTMDVIFSLLDLINIRSFFCPKK